MEKEKKNSNKIAFIAIALIVVAIVAIAIGSAFMNKPENNDNNQNTQNTRVNQDVPQITNTDLPVNEGVTP